MQHTLATRRRVRSPAAMGLMPPSFFLMAKSLAPAIHCAHSRGTLPAKKVFVITVVERSARSAAAVLAHWITDCKWHARSPEGPGPDAWENDLSAVATCAVDTCRAGVWFCRGVGGAPGGCLSDSCCMTDEDEDAMPKEVNADAALERSPSDANVNARRAFTSICSGWPRVCGLEVRFEDSEVKAAHSETMSPANSALQRDIMSSWILRSDLEGPLRTGTLRHNLARAVLKAHACGEPVWYAHASVTAMTSA